MNMFFAAIRLALVTMIGCCVVYTSMIWGVAQFCFPASANGHLLSDTSGKLIGGWQIAQKFTLDKYFHGRPSAVDYDGMEAGGSNLSSTSLKLRKRAEAIITKYGVGKEHPIPVDLVTASGSGLDPHISLAAACFQIPRIARTRNVSEESIGMLVRKSLSYPGGFITSEPLVNVLELNIKLDQMH